MQASQELIASKETEGLRREKKGRGRCLSPLTKRFLVIPCCFYGLDGTRALTLRATEEEQGKYKAYTRYIKDIIVRCGFECEEDYLRIPSTKNIALVGRRRRDVDMTVIQEMEASPASAFVPRKNDRIKQELRRELKLSKIEKRSNRTGSSALAPP